VFPISAVTGDSVEPLVEFLAAQVRTLRGGQATPLPDEGEELTPDDAPGRATRS